MTAKERQYLYDIRVNWTLDMKIRHFIKVVKVFIEEIYPVDAVVSFSGGADSLVMLDIIRKNINPHFPAVFSDTGVEFPEIRKFVKTFPDCHIIKPAIPYKKVLEKYGYPVISKKTARFIYDLQRPAGSNDATKNLRLTGYNQAGKYLPFMKIPKKWLPLVDAPFKISHKCCDYIKKAPLQKWQKKNNALPVVGIMASESNMRKLSYYQHGCNVFNGQKSICRPLSIFTSKDIWEYIKSENLTYCEIYDCGYRQTGCVSCGFGCHLDKGENRYQKLYKSHPKLWNYHIDNLGWGKVLEYINIPTK